MMDNKYTYGIPEYALDRIKAIFKTHPKISKVWLYGSRALGTYRLGSDIDLCLEGPLLNTTDLLQIENQLDDLLLPWKIDLSIRQGIDNGDLLEHITQNGKILYEKTP